MEFIAQAQKKRIRHICLLGSIHIFLSAHQLLLEMYSQNNHSNGRVNVTVTVYTCIREVIGSRISAETGTFLIQVFVAFLSRSKIIAGDYSDYATTTVQLLSYNCFQRLYSVATYLPTHVYIYTYKRIMYLFILHTIIQTSIKFRMMIEDPCRDLNTITSKQFHLNCPKFWKPQKKAFFHIAPEIFFLSS